MSEWLKIEILDVKYQGRVPKRNALLETMTSTNLVKSLALIYSRCTRRYFCWK